MAQGWKRALRNIAERVKKTDPGNPVVKAIEHELDPRKELRDRDELGKRRLPRVARKKRVPV